ncbi:hypothetical protein BZM26_37995 [Paraburkholderia strydomiana]|nr:hypothetical protein BZM26_37995 [Paraburkholderia strydomiana]
MPAFAHDVTRSGTTAVRSARRKSPRIASGRLEAGDFQIAGAQVRRTACGFARATQQRAREIYLDANAALSSVTRLSLIERRERHESHIYSER